MKNIEKRRKTFISGNNQLMNDKTYKILPN